MSAKRDLEVIRWKRTMEVIGEGKKDPKVIRWEEDNGSDRRGQRRIP